MVGTIVGRKKKDADRVNYNISRIVRVAVLQEADKLNWNEIDTIEDLLRHGLAAKSMLKSGEINYSRFSKVLDALMSSEEGAGKPKRSPNDPADTADSLSKDSSGSFEARSPTDEEPIDLLPETTARSNDLNT